MAATRAYDLKLLVGRENIMGNRPRVVIESLETSGKNLYIGASDGSLYHFLLLEDVQERTGMGSSNNSSQLSSFMQTQKKIGTKKSIVQIKATTQLNCLLINSDGGIYAYSMIDLEPAFAIFGKMKNVSKFYVNDSPAHPNPFAVEMCVSYIKKKNVQIYQVQEDNIIPLKEISLQEHPQAFALDGRHICAATSSGYVIIDMDSNARQELLPVAGNKSFVYKVAPAEFLLAAPNALGVFVTSAGISQRAPIQWSVGVSHACFSHPYVIAMDDEFITVHSVIDQQQKQTVPFQGGTTLVKSNGKLVVCTAKDVFVLIPIPYSVQISDLLSGGRVEEAMELAKACHKSMPRVEYQGMMLTTYKKAGFVHFQRLEFNDAEEMFVNGCIDIREVISLYHGILPTDSSFIRNFPPYHNIANVQQLCNGDVEKLFKYEEFLASYLQIHTLPKISTGSHSDGLFEGSSSMYVAPAFRSDIFLSTVALFAKLHNTEQILQLLAQHDVGNRLVGSSLFHEFQSFADEVSQILESAGCYNAQAINLLLNDDLDGAVSLWKKLASGKKIDGDFPGLEYVAECLGRYCKDISILWKHAEWILEMDERVGVSIFTDHLPHAGEASSLSEQSEGVCSPKPEDVIAFLHRYQKSVVMYLEHLIFVCRVPKEKHHTHLAVLYLDQVLRLKEQTDRDEEEFAAARAKFQKLLKYSSIYRVSLILAKVKESGMFAECVILHSKQGEHEQALDILVNHMSERGSAEEYCLAQGLDHDGRSHLFKHLLGIYLSKMSGFGKSTESAMAAVDLLNNYAEYYDAQAVLESLPKSWSVALLSQFLCRNVRLRMHNVQTSLLRVKLERSENNNVRKEQVQLRNTSVRLTEDKICQGCNRLFQDVQCAAYPNGVSVHVQCGTNRYVCPVTGRLFKTFPPPKTHE